MSQAFYAGIDVGTTAVKAAIYTPEGRQVVVERCAVQVDRNADGHSEIPMEALWVGVKKCLHAIAKHVDVQNIKAVGVCGQGDGLWILDAKKQPIRPAILWNDARARDYIQAWIDDGNSDAISRYCRTAIWPGASGPALRWLQDNEPENFARIAHLVTAKDWIVYRLTGQLGTDYSDASIPFLDLETKHYATTVFSHLGLTNLSHILAKPKRATDLAGVVTADVGLPPIPVATGALDLAAMMSGLGLETPGDMCLILGTTAVLSYVMRPEPYTTPPLAATVHHPCSNDWIRVFAPQTGASAFDWFASLHPQTFGGANSAEIAAKINRAATDVPPGANGVLFLPFLTGERAPFVAPEASASFHGMRASTTKADLARAVMEGTCFSLLHCLLSGKAAKVERVVLTGGGARNTLWCQIMADILGISILVDTGEDHGLRGAAFYGAMAAQEIKEITVPKNEAFTTYRPDPQAHKVYQSIFMVYLNAIDANRAVWKSMRTKI